MQQERFEIFESQDPENEHFDVTFEIDGKTILANKLLLTSSSEYMNALLSDRWTKKDEPVKIDDYSYDNFYEFLRFLYLGSCNLTNENVFQLIDMAECYDVKRFKNYCENFLSRMKYDIERIEEMFEFADTYSLKKMKNAIKNFIGWNLDKVTGAERFLSSKKSFVDFLSSVNTFSKEEKLFKAVYKWTEHQVMKQKDADDKNFDLLEAVKDELRKTFPQIFSMDKSKMSKDFLMHFMTKKRIFFSPDEFKSIYEGIRRSDGEFCYRIPTFNHSNIFDDKFKALVLAEKQDKEKKKQALKKQKMNPNENFNLADSVKTLLSKVIPNVEFFKMDETFVMCFIVAKGILTEEQANHVFDIRVSVTNFFKTITGDFKDDIGIGQAIELKSPYEIQQSSDKIIRFLDLKFRMPKTPSIVKKTDGVEWYLSLDEDRVLSFKHHTMVNPSDYLLAEMKSETEFSLTPDKYTSLEARFNILNDILQ
uniref:BTB domain-containing protein n=1 Tax=Panagrolaimus davidi TaxID=227884 RepID=A0A914P1T2_9BILA